MPNNIFQSFHPRRASLISKILFFFIISLLVVGLILGISFTSRIKPQLKNDILPNLGRYIEYIVEDIGLPPDLGKAESLASELPFELRIEGDNIAWSSNPLITVISNYDLRQAPHPYGDYQIGSGSGNHVLVTEKQGYRFMFVVNNSFEAGSRKRHVILFLVLATTLFALYLAMRRLFKPIESISSHLQKISAGNFEEPIEMTGEDELAQLARGINNMAEQIKSMLDGKAGLLLAISHELRSPLTRMRVNLELLDKSNTQQLLIDDIREMELLVSNILESEKLNTRHTALNRSDCNLESIIESVVEQYFSGQKLISKLSSARGYFDQVRISLLVKNLLDNAFKYTGSESEPVEISMTVDHAWVVIEFIDHGSGINPEVLAHIIEPFYRTDEARQRVTGGYGLGLYLCKQIVNAHAGTIDFESTPGEGTRVTVRLPLSNEDKNN